MLDWTARLEFFPELFAMPTPATCRPLPSSVWMPMGATADAEARLEVFGPKAYPGHPAWRELTTWWLSHPAGANTPDWDIAASCDVEGRPGLILVEAKANIPELGIAGKPIAPDASKNSLENHERIGRAIAEARAGLSEHLPCIAISATSHYQLGNRLAFAWKLATLGIPTVLTYLGFTGDEGLRGVGAPFENDAHWQCCTRACETVTASGNCALSPIFPMMPPRAHAW